MNGDHDYRSLRERLERMIQMEMGTESEGQEIGEEKRGTEARWPRDPIMFL